jgi:hypothetical protein
MRIHFFKKELLHPLIGMILPLLDGFQEKFPMDPDDFLSIEYNDRNKPLYD